MQIIMYQHISNNENNRNFDNNIERNNKLYNDRHITTINIKIT